MGNRTLIVIVFQISDMGLGKQLIGHSSYGGASLINESSLGFQSNGGASSLVGVGPGSVGWQAPEVMAARNANSDASARSEGSDYTGDLSPLELSPGVRTSRSVDIFSLGCVFYSLLVPGCHPFGEWYEREANIMHNRPNLEPLFDLSPEAFDLIKSMLRRSAPKRPTASEVGSHPFFWTAHTKLSFLCELSDRIEIDTSAPNEASDTTAVKSVLLLIERNASSIVGTSWDSHIDSDLLTNVQRFRSYDPSSVRDLLRLLRNKHHHYDELSTDLKSKIGCKVKGLMQYFESRFPRYVSVIVHCFLMVLCIV
jgi:serine/threonine-protein kinase/endoribonuclease IRE1